LLFPALQQPPQLRVTVTRFLGLDRSPDTPQGAFTDLTNMSSLDYPTLSVRPARGTVTTLALPLGLTQRESLVWCDGGRLLINGCETGLLLSASAEKQFVSMGAYLVIFPDKMYINTRDLSDYGSLENTAVTTGTVTFTLCRADGDPYSDYTVSAAAPETPAGGALWLDTSGDAPVLRQYDAAAPGWTAVAATYVKISAAGIGRGFSAGDGVTVSGCSVTDLNGSFVLSAAADDYLTVPGVLSAARTQTAALTVRRAVPDMDYVTECGNRLWGCQYGLVDGLTVNAVYACKLGDFKNWQCFEGLATDSYAAARGADGPFTGAVTHLGNPLFFREHSLEKVYPAASGAHQIVTIECQGVQKGSARSLCVVEGVLYYHGIGGIYTYDGSLPRNVSRALGAARYRNAAAGAVDGRYYVSMQDETTGAWHLFCCDTRRSLWHREDNTHAMAFAPVGSDLFCLEAGTGRILSLLGSQGVKETDIPFAAETGDWGLADMEHKYLQRLEARVLLSEGASLSLYVSYDSGGTWEKKGAVTGTAALRPAVLPIRPKRCGQVRLRLTGTGGCRLYTLCGVYGKGSDTP